MEIEQPNFFKGYSIIFSQKTKPLHKGHLTQPKFFSNYRLQQKNYQGKRH